MKKITNRWPILLVLSGGVFILVFILQQGGRENLADQPSNPVTVAVPKIRPTAKIEPPTASQPPTTVPTAVPIIPTLEPTPDSEPDPQPTATSGFVTETPAPSIVACTPVVCTPRFGASGTLPMISAAFTAGLPFGHYFDWELEIDPVQIGEATYWQMIRVSEDGIRHDWAEIALVARANPGSIWIVGNEPDIVWQDNTTPERFAVAYHDAYTFIKEQDPSAQIAIGAVGQPTPLRLAYLDQVLETYIEQYDQPLPVDIWTIHNFILREEADSWGVGIPPGMTDSDQGILYEIDDHDDLEIFEQNLIDFRHWLADRGYRDRPLAVTEFGILMPADFGFPPEVVAEFLTATLEILVQTSDDSIGYPTDDNRLVQWSFWYSVYDGDEFPTGNLYNPETGILTPLGEQFAAFINGN